MLRRLITQYSSPLKSICFTPGSFFGSTSYIRNKNKGTVQKIHQKVVDLGKFKQEQELGKQSPITKEDLMPEKEKAKKTESTLSGKQESRQTKSGQENTEKGNKNENSSSSGDQSEIVTSVLEDQSITREKQLSVKLLKANTKENLFRFYDKHMIQIKPIHMSIALFQAMKLWKMEQKLKRLSVKSLKRKNLAVYTIWEDENFLQIYKNVMENVENMNPDSLVRVLAAISLTKSKREEFKALFNRVIEWLIKDQNIMLFDRIQALKMLVCFSKIASRDFYKNRNNGEFLSLLVSKLKIGVHEQPTKNIIRIYLACLKLKHYDPTFIQLINAQVKKRIKHLFPNNLIICCAVNLNAKAEYNEKFIRNIIHYMENHSLTKGLRLKDYMNLLVLSSEIINSNLSNEFKQEITNLADLVVSRIMNIQNKYLRGDYHNKSKDEDTVPEEKQQESETKGSTRVKNLRIMYLDKLLKSLIMLKKYEKNVTYMIEVMLENNCLLSMRDLAYVITYLLQYTKYSDTLDKYTRNHLLALSLRKLEERLVRMKAEEIQLMHYILQEILQGDQGLLDDLKPMQGFTTSSKLIMRKFLHSIINTNYQLPLSTLIKEAAFLDANREIKIDENKIFEVLEFYVRSIRKNILQPLFVSNPEEETDGNGASIKLEINEKIKSNIVSSLWILSIVFSKEFPLIDNTTVLQEYFEVIQQHFGEKDLSGDNLDLLIEVYSLFANSVNSKQLSQLLEASAFKARAEKTLKDFQESSLSRRQIIRNSIINTIQSLPDFNNANFSENVVLPEMIQADIIFERLGKKYVILLNSEPAEDKLLGILDLSEKVNPITKSYSPLKERILSYKGYKTLFINMREWNRRDEAERKESIKNLFQD